MNPQYQAFLRKALSPQPKLVLDDTGDDDDTAAADYASADIRVKAAAIAQAWAATSPDDLADGETLIDRLDALVFGVIDADMDGELSADEQTMAEIVYNALWDYLSSKGVSDEDCEAMLNDGDDEAAARVKDLLAETLGTGDDADDAAQADIDGFAFDTEAESAVFDSTGELVLDAVYRKKVVIRGGRKMKVNKRISGHVRLSSKQKIAVRAMLRKSHSAGAMMRRMRSMKIRYRQGL